MTTPHVRLTSAQRSALDSVEAAGIAFRREIRRLSELQHQFDALLLAAVEDSDCAVTDVAVAAGISRQGFYNSADRAKRYRTPRLGDDAAE